MTSATAWPGYADALREARSSTTHAESVSWRVQRDALCTAVVVTGHFTFLGGSMGEAHGDVVVEAVDVAIDTRVPIIFCTSSGGARTQEGFTALFQMPRILAAVLRLKQSGLPVISVFRHPTTGGVHASYGAAADVIIAEAGATVGFAGPRVVEAFTGEIVDRTLSHTAEQYFVRGLVDELVPAGDGLDAAMSWVRTLRPMDALTPVPPPARSASRSYHGWEAVLRARRPDRPTARETARALLSGLREIRGDRSGVNDPVVLAGFGRLGGRAIAIIGTDRGARLPGASRAGLPSAAGFRKATRIVRTASRLGIPVLSLVDTRGADASPQSDNSGLTSAISDLSAALLSADVISICAVIGEGGSGGAIAFASTDVLLMQDDAVFEVIAPEGAAAIVYRDPSLAPSAAEYMRLDASSLSDDARVDAVVPGPTSIGASRSLAALRSEIRAQLLSLAALSPLERQQRRHEKYA